jgi:Spy/CpxP family protein refolding chaperone
VKLSRAVIAMYVGLIFACGVVLGAFGQRLYTASTVAAKQRPNPEEFRKKVVAEYQSRLKLTPDQMAKLNAIMDETRARMEETRRSMRPSYQKIHEDQVQKIHDILTPDQQMEYDKMRKEREERQKQNGKGA